MKVQNRRRVNTVLRQLCGCERHDIEVDVTIKSGKYSSALRSATLLLEF